MVFSEVKYQPERSKIYLGSPGLIRLQDGTLVACHDYFGELKNLEGECGLTSVYRSKDNGLSWLNVNHLLGTWGSMFLVNNVLYHICNAQEYGDIIIRRSEDGGFTWTVPTDKISGVLFRAGKGHKNPNYHMSASAVFIYNGRIYKTCEDLLIDHVGPEWNPEKFQAFVISAPLDSDLLQAANWNMSNKVKFDYTLIQENNLAGPNNGWLEGTINVGLDGKLHSLMRVDLLKPNKAAIFDLSDDGKKLSFDYRNGIIDFIGGNAKFTIRRDEKTGLYFTLTNRVIEPDVTWRNILNLVASSDLHHWKDLKTILSDDSGFEPEYSRAFTGFQYPDWQFDGDDIIYLLRTAYRGAHSYHDSNRITYHVLKDFRQYIK